MRYRTTGRRRRRGQVIVLALFTLVVLLGFCALAIDVMYIYLSQTELQNAVDAASLAAATELVGNVDGDVKDRAKVLANQFAWLNRVTNRHLQLADSDIKFGRYDGDTRQLILEQNLAEGETIDSIWVRGRRTNAAPDGPIRLFFAPIFGLDRAQVAATAVASQRRRYVMFVMDRSGSMCYDTTGVVRKYTSRWTDTNSYIEYQYNNGVYAYGPSYNSRLEAFRKDVPGDVDSYAGWMWMPDYMLIKETRTLPRQSGGTETKTYWWRHYAYFFAKDQGSGAPRSDFLLGHVTAKMASERPRFRAYTYWSGSTPVFSWQNWQSWNVWNGGSMQHFRYVNRDSTGSIDSGWMKIPADVDVYGGFSNMSDSLRGHYFSAKSYGPVTGRCGYAVARAPVQPIQDSQDAAIEFISLLDHRKDRCGLATYAQKGTLDFQLTDDWAALSSAVQSYDPKGGTAMADGMKRANEELESERVLNSNSSLSLKVMILITDGNANVVNGTTYGNPWGTITFNQKSITCGIHQTVATAIEQQAVRARNNNVRVYTVSFGQDADLKIMPEIATMTNGLFYYAENSEDLTDVFRDIFKRLPPLLTQ